MLSRQDELELVAAAKNGDKKAMLRLVTAHEPMINRIVRQWKPRDPEDLHAHLTMVFIETLPRFVAEKECRVNTYLRWYLFEAARHYTNAATNITRIPGAITQRYGGFIRREMKRLENQGLSINAIHIHRIAKQLGISDADVEMIIAHAQPGMSIDTLMQDNPIFLQEPNQEIALQEQQERQILSEALTKLDPRERRIIEARHATYDDPLTLEDLSLEYGVSRERIRQIEAKALLKVKNYIRTLRSENVRDMALAA